MEKLKFYNFGLKLYNKLIISYPLLSSLMFSKIKQNKPQQINITKMKPKQVPQMNMMNTMPMNMMNYMPMNMMPMPNIMPINNMMSYYCQNQYMDMNTNYMGYYKYYK
jgi:hypothetical protein